MSEKEKDLYERTIQKEWIGPIVLIVSIILLIVLFFLKPKGQEINSNLFIGVLTALFGLLGIMLQINSIKDIEAKRRLHELELNHRNALAQIRMRSYDARRKTYQQLLGPFIKVMTFQKSGKQFNLQELTEEMIKVGIDIYLLGSDETCRAWQEFKAIGFKGKSQNEQIARKRNAAILIFYARIILSIRRDLGQDDTEVSEIEILRSFISDIDEYLEELQEAQLWKTVSDVP